MEHRRIFKRYRDFKVKGLVRTTIWAIELQSTILALYLIDSQYTECTPPGAGGEDKMKQQTNHRPHHRLLRGLSSPSEGRFALSRTFARGRFLLLPFYPG